MTDKEKRNKMIVYFESYKKYKSFIKLADMLDKDIPFEKEAALDHLRSVYSFVISLPDCKEKLLLYYHYIQCESMERTAEILGVALRSAYRIRLRALLFAADQFPSSATMCAAS